MLQKTQNTTTASPTDVQDEQSGGYSLICRDLENESSKVTLCSVPCEALPVEIHAVIIIQMMDDGKRELWKADFNPTVGGNKICQKGVVRRVRIAEKAENDEEIQQATDYIKLTQKMTVHGSWVIDLDKAEQLLRNIAEEVDKQDVNYSLTGESIESSVKGKLKPSEGDFHNCVTWARRMLNTAGLGVDETKLPIGWKLTMIYEKNITK